MAYWHSLMDQEMHDEFVALDCDWKMPDMIGVDKTCMDLYMKFDSLVSEVNVYDIFGTCWGAGPYPQAEEPVEKNFAHLYNAGSESHMHKKFSTPAEYTPWTSHKSTHGAKALKELPPCTFGTGLLDYMNSDSVRTAMHIPSYVQAWDLCSEEITYISEP